MGKKTNEVTASTSLGKGVFLSPVSDKGGISISTATAHLEEQIAALQHDADGNEEEAAFARTSLKDYIETHGESFQEERHGAGYDIDIPSYKLEALERFAQWQHFHSSIDDGEPKPHLHNVIPNCVRHELPPADAELRIVHTVKPRTKGKSAVAGRVTDIYRGSAGLPLAGTVFDPRRYRRIK